MNILEIRSSKQKNSFEMLLRMGNRAKLIDQSTGECCEHHYNSTALD